MRVQRELLALALCLSLTFIACTEAEAPARPAPKTVAMGVPASVATAEALLIATGQDEAVARPQVAVDTRLPAVQPSPTPPSATESSGAGQERVTAAITVTQPSLAVASPAPAPTIATPSSVRVPLEQPHWVKNFKITGMWSASGAVGDDGKPAIHFGDTSTQFCSFQVVLPAEQARLYVWNPYWEDYFWIDIADVGPINNEPEHLPGPKPPGQNCAGAIYDE